MKINWKPSVNRSPILFSHHSEFTGFKIRHLRVLPGEVVERADPFHKINITLEGSVLAKKHSANGKLRTSRVEQGFVCVNPAGQPASILWEEEMECLTIMLNPVFVAQTAMEQNFTAKVEFIETYEKQDALIRHIGLALLTETIDSERIGGMYAESLAQTLILHLLKNYTVSGSLPHAATNTGGLPGFKLRLAKEFINEHLAEEITLALVSGAVGLSQFHFARAFRRSTGLTPQQYLVSQRIHRAKELLINGDLPLVQVGIQVGFKNQSHFTTVFRKFTALTPKAFREAKRH